MQGRCFNRYAYSTIVGQAAALLALCAALAPGIVSNADEIAVRRVDLAGDAARIQITGCQSFKAASIRNAVARDFFYQAAARPSGTIDALVAAVQNAVLRGYAHVGYAKAEVTAGFDDAANCLTLNIVEGQQYVAAEIEVLGAKNIDADELARRLRQPVAEHPWTYTRGGDEVLQPLESEYSEAAWQVGEHVEMDMPSAKRLPHQIRRRLAEMGWPFAKFKQCVEFDDEKAAAKLVVTIEAEGSPAVLDEVSIAGLTRHTPEQLKEFLGLARGLPLTAETIDRVHEALRQSCRFWGYDVNVRLSDLNTDRYAPGLAQAGLKIRVVEYEPVAPLGEPLTEVDECLKRAVKWLKDFQESATDDELRMRGLLASYGAVDAVLSPRRGAVVRLKNLDGHQFYRLDSALIHSPGRMEIYDWLANQRLEVFSDSRPQFSLSIAPDAAADGRFITTMKIGMGVSNKTPRDGSVHSLWAVAAEPVALVHLAHREGARAALADGVLTIENGPLTLRIRQDSGALIDIRCGGESDGFSIEVVQGQYESLRDNLEAEATHAKLKQCFNPGAPWTTAARFFLRVIEQQPNILNDARQKSLVNRVSEFLEDEDHELQLEDAVDRVGLETHRDRSEGAEKFVIPIVASTSVDLSFLGLGTEAPIAEPWIADYLFPRGTPPWTVVREAAFHSAKPSEFVDVGGGAVVEFSQMLATPAAGPLTAFAATRLLAGCMSDVPTADKLIASSLATFDQRDISSDAALLVVGDHGIARFVRTVVKFCDELDAEGRAALIDAAPAEYRGVLVKLFERRSASPDESPEAAVQAALIDAWNDRLREHMRSHLEALAASARSEGDRTAQTSETIAIE